MNEEVDLKDLPTREEMFEALRPLMKKYEMYGVVVSILNREHIQSYKYDKLPLDTSPEDTKEFYINILEAVLNNEKRSDLGKYNFIKEEVSRIKTDE